MGVHTHICSHTRREQRSVLRALLYCSSPYAMAYGLSLKQAASCPWTRAWAFQHTHNLCLCTHFRRKNPFRKAYSTLTTHIFTGTETWLISYAASPTPAYVPETPLHFYLQEHIYNPVTHKTGRVTMRWIPADRWELYTTYGQSLVHK